MKIESARRQGDELCLTTKDPEAWRWLYSFKPGDYEIRPKRKKRSLDANSFLWSLIGQIASVVNVPSDEVYRRAIHEAGVYTPLPIKAEAVRSFPGFGALMGSGGLWTFWTTANSPVISSCGLITVRVHMTPRKCPG